MDINSLLLTDIDQELPLTPPPSSPILKPSSPRIFQLSIEIPKSIIEQQKNEILFFKVFNNKYLFNYIFNEIELINKKKQEMGLLNPIENNFNNVNNMEEETCYRIKFKEIKSLSFMVENRLYNLLKLKIINESIQIDNEGLYKLFQLGRLEINSDGDNEDLKQLSKENEQLLFEIIRILFKFKRKEIKHFNLLKLSILLKKDKTNQFNLKLFKFLVSPPYSLEITTEIFIYIIINHKFEYFQEFLQLINTNCVYNNNIQLNNSITINDSFRINSISFALMNKDENILRYILDNPQYYSIKLSSVSTIPTTSTTKKLKLTIPTSKNDIKQIFELKSLDLQLKLLELNYFDYFDSTKHPQNQEFNEFLNFILTNQTQCIDKKEMLKNLYQLFLASSYLSDNLYKDYLNKFEEMFLNLFEEKYINMVIFEIFNNYSIKLFIQLLEFFKKDKEIEYSISYLLQNYNFPEFKFNNRHPNFYNFIKFYISLKNNNCCDIIKFNNKIKNFKKCKSIISNPKQYELMVESISRCPDFNNIYPPKWNILIKELCNHNNTIIEIDNFDSIDWITNNYLNYEFLKSSPYIKSINIFLIFNNEILNINNNNLQQQQLQLQKEFILFFSFPNLNLLDYAINKFDQIPQLKFSHIIQFLNQDENQNKLIVQQFKEFFYGIPFFNAINNFDLKTLKEINKRVSSFKFIKDNYYKLSIDPKIQEIIQYFNSIGWKNFTNKSLTRFIKTIIDESDNSSNGLDIMKLNFDLENSIIQESFINILVYGIKWEKMKYIEFFFNYFLGSFQLILNSNNCIIQILNSEFLNENDQFNKELINFSYFNNFNLIYREKYYQEYNNLNSILLYLNYFLNLYQNNNNNNNNNNNQLIDSIYEIIFNFYFKLLIQLKNISIESIKNYYNLIFLELNNNNNNNNFKLNHSSFHSIYYISKLNSCILNYLFNQQHLLEYSFENRKINKDLKDSNYNRNQEEKNIYNVQELFKYLDLSIFTFDKIFIGDSLNEISNQLIYNTSIKQIESLLINGDNITRSLNRNLKLLLDIGDINSFYNHLEFIQNQFISENENLIKDSLLSIFSKSIEDSTKIKFYYKNKFQQNNNNNNNLNRIQFNFDINNIIKIKESIYFKKLFK